MTLHNCACALILSVALGGTATAQDRDDDIGSIKVTDNIHMLTGNGGNIGVLIGTDGTFMIDDKFAPLSEAIVAKVEALGGAAPKYLLNTHFHGDHTGGNENLGKSGSLIVAHENVRKRLAAGSEIAAFKMVMPPQSGAALPVITFSRDIRFYLNGETIDVVHVPAAHTDGDSFVHFPDANVIHTGDVVFNGFYPFIDVAHGGTVSGMIDATDSILALADERTRIIPGHGPLADKAQVRAYRDMLMTARERLGKLRAAGKTVAQAVAEKPLADLDAEWSDGIFSSDRWIELVYDGV